MPEIFRARTITPMTAGQAAGQSADLPVIHDGALAVKDGVIVACGAFDQIRREHAGPVRDLGPVTLAPAVFNSHVHLEMTHLLGKTTRGQGFVPWVRSLLAQPLYTPEPATIRAELFRLEQKGCAFLADISTRNARQMAEILAPSGLFFASFQEAIGNAVPDDPASLLHECREAAEAGDRGVCSVAGHALYSTSAGLMRAAKAVCRERGLPFSLHLAEHADEDAILLTGRSEFLDLMYERGFMSSYEAPGMRPAPLAASLGLLDERTLCVHCVTVDAADMATIAASRASVCLCPRSNAYIGVGKAPLREFLAAGVNVCLGTDGLCSNDDLDPYGELAFLGEQGCGLGLCEALALITVNPARFFGLSGRLGSLAPGREARLSIVPEKVLQLFKTC
jgi:cytosine/adenosine deaminase-related metal-dependent hydrolase